MFKNNNRKNKRGYRGAMTIVETGFAIIIGLVVIAGAITAYKKLYIPMKGDTAYSQIASVINALERAKMTNGGVYPVAGGSALNTIPIILNELGGANNSRDVASWTYSCSAGSNRTITLVTTAFDDQTVASIAAVKTTNSLAPWSGVEANSIVTVTLPNVTCN